MDVCTSTPRIFHTHMTWSALLMDWKVGVLASAASPCHAWLEKREGGVEMAE